MNTDRLLQEVSNSISQIKNSSDTLEDVMPLFYINLSVYDKEHIKYKFNDAIESLMDAISSLNDIKHELRRLMKE